VSVTSWFECASQPTFPRHTRKRRLYPKPSTSRWPLPENAGRKRLTRGEPGRSEGTCWPPSPVDGGEAGTCDPAGPSSRSKYPSVAVAESARPPDHNVLWGVRRVTSNATVHPRHESLN
jgi:hypothetical protein